MDPRLARKWTFNVGLVALILFVSCAPRFIRMVPATVQYSTPAQQRRAAVGIEVECADGKAWRGTGVIVSSRTVLTARHVVDCGKVAAKSFVVKTLGGKRHDMLVTWMHGKADTAMLMIESKTLFRRDERVPYVTAPWQYDQVVCRAAAVPYHGRFCGTVQGTYKGQVRYDHIGQSGNSGSGVFDVQGRLVGLHVAGFQCRAFGFSSRYFCRESLFDTNI